MTASEIRTPTVKLWLFLMKDVAAERIPDLTENVAIYSLFFFPVEALIFLLNRHGIGLSVKWPVI